MCNRCHVSMFLKFFGRREQYVFAEYRTSCQIPLQPLNHVLPATLLFMTLMKLRLHHPHADPGVRFSVSMTTVTDTIHTWIALLYLLFGGLIAGGIR